MARAYPRFLYSAPTNTKSPGPFVVHCLEPRIIFGVLIDERKNHKLQLLDLAPSPDLEEAYGDVFMAASIWFIQQLKGGYITL